MRSRIVNPCLPPEAGAAKKAKAAAITGPAIVRATSKQDRDRRRDAAADTEASPEVKAFFARMMRPPGS